VAPNRRIDRSPNNTARKYSPKKECNNLIIIYIIIMIFIMYVCKAAIDGPPEVRQGVPTLIARL
jgi:hypothetical protein